MSCTHTHTHTPNLSTHSLHTENSSTYFLSLEYIYIYIKCNYLSCTSVMLTAIIIFIVEFLLDNNIIFMTASSNISFLL
jgi:hypothetical protein